MNTYQNQSQVKNIYEKQAKHNKELFTFMYGSLVIRLTKDIEDPHEINKQLELIGYNIGQRIIDDIIDIGEPIKEIVPDMLNILFKRFLAINPFNLQSKSEKEYVISFQENPLNLFVELPDKYKELWYANLICGVIRGMFQMVNYIVECVYLKDKLKGDSSNEISLVVKEIVEERFVDNEE